MDKFQKYCLSVLLVIICGNISAQTGNASTQNIECKKLQEIYSRFLNFQECNDSCGSEVCKKPAYYHSIHHSYAAIDLLRIFPLKKQTNPYHNQSGLLYSGKEKQNTTLNIEGGSKENSFTVADYLKSKVSKIRNKDYLDLMA